MSSLVGTRILLGAIAVVAICTLGWVAMLRSQIYGNAGWRDQVYTYAGAVAARQAMDDYREGHLRLYRLGEEQERELFTGETNGAFEVWTPQYYPSLGAAHRYAEEEFIRFYNRKMEYMYAHPDKFRRGTRTVQLDGAANRSQPIRVETNRTSVSAGSDR